MQNEELPKAYDPKLVEDKWYSSWLEQGLFSAKASSKKPAYSIVIPPPNVTGVLTIGHVLNNTLQDILCRRKRQQGFEVLWLPGTDHAGIATQTVVERTLKKEGVIKHRDDLGREEFLKKVWEWKDKHGGIIIQQLKKLGCSCDWEREVFTMDGLDARDPNPKINYAECVQKVFVELYNKGLIYRGKKMVNWCPVSRTALSDEEVVMKEVEGHLWYLKYPLLCKEGDGGGSNFITVATTRPETMLGDEAVAVNPKDKRYKHLIGKKIKLPLRNKEIPIIADELVESSFGTGAVKVTPAHDPADYEMGLKHSLPLTIVIAQDGTMTRDAGEKYEGLDRYECRRAVVSDMESLELLEKVEPYKHNIGFSQRADVPIEPYLSEQWFLKYPKVNEAKKAVKSGKIKFWPDRWAKVYTHWLDNIRDWCISRQLWWGHRIPAWYCVPLLRKEGVGEVEILPPLTPPYKGGEFKMCSPPNPPLTKVRGKCIPIVSIEKPAKCPHCGGTQFTQDFDVLDTWFSSWLWPFATLGWPENSPELKKFYPTNDLVTGPDIIFFWVARMIMAGFQFMGEKPFDNVYFTGIIRDSQGRKMSKSLGNSPDPLDLIAKYGADGLRFGLMLIAPKGQDILFSEDRVEVGRNFMNKLWNASRFVMMNVTPKASSLRKQGSSELKWIPAFAGMTSLSLADKWILNRLQHAIKDVNHALDKYQFDTAAHAIYQFVWGEFCDWYLELSKTTPSPLVEEGRGEGCVLIYVLDHILRLLHPFAPFITEEIWQMTIPLLRKEGAGEVETLPPLTPPYKGGEFKRCSPSNSPLQRGSIQFSEYPKPAKKIEYAKEALEMQVIMDVISAIRNIRGEHNVNPGKEISVILRVHDKKLLKTIEDGKKYITTLARVGDIKTAGVGESPKQCATAVAGKIDIFVPFAGMIDIEDEKLRLSKEVLRVEKYIDSMEVKLSNKNFVDRAPKDVVEKERERLAGAKAEREKFKNALNELS